MSLDGGLWVGFGQLKYVGMIVFETVATFPLQTLSR